MQRHLVRSADENWAWLKEFYVDHVLKTAEQKVRMVQINGAPDQITGTRVLLNLF